MDTENLLGLTSNAILERLRELMLSHAGEDWAQLLGALDNRLSNTNGALPGDWDGKVRLPAVKPERRKVLFCTRSLGAAYFPNRVSIHKIGCSKAPTDGQASGPYGWRVTEIREATAPAMLAPYTNTPGLTKTTCRSCGGLKP
jgi:hypothetical protein